ncbi:MAG: hypothetical protein ACRDD1_06570, partial [Planctomycetia bacterium]
STVGALPTAVTLAQGVLQMIGLEKLKYAAVFAASLLAAGGLAFGMLQDDPTRFEKGLCGDVVSLTPGQPTTVTIALDDFGTLLKLDVAPDAKVWAAFEKAELADVKEGRYVSLRLKEDHRTVNEIHVQGEQREASIREVASSGKIVVIEDDDDDGVTKEVELAPDAVLRIGGLPAVRADLKPGMTVPLEFGRDGKLVNAIEADAAEGTMIEGEFLASKDSAVELTVEVDDANGVEKEVRRTFTLDADAVIRLDGKPAKPADLKPGSWVELRLSGPGGTIRSLNADSPEPDDDEPTPKPEPQSAG